MSGVGDVKSLTRYGVYSVYWGKRIFSRVCMDRVTMQFLFYEMEDVEHDTHARCQLESGDSPSNSIRKVLNEVGDDNDIYIKEYLYTCPREIWKSKSGVAVFDSQFVSQDGTTGFVYGQRDILRLTIIFGNPTLEAIFY